MRSYLSNISTFSSLNAFPDFHLITYFVSVNLSKVHNVSSYFYLYIVSLLVSKFFFLATFLKKIKQFKLGINRKIDWNKHQLKASMKH